MLKKQLSCLIHCTIFLIFTPFIILHSAQFTLHSKYLKVDKLSRTQKDRLLEINNLATEISDDVSWFLKDHKLTKSGPYKLVLTKNDQFFAGATVYTPISATRSQRYQYLKQNTTRFSYDFPLSGDFAVGYKNAFPKLENPALGRIFNPGIQYHNGKLHFILRYNRLEKETGSYYLPDHKYYIKNNTLLATTLLPDLSIQQVPLEFQPFYDFLEKSKTFDCELDPDWADGGHGEQDARIFTLNDHLYMIFNARQQLKEKGLPCPNLENYPQRGIFISKLITDKLSGFITGWHKAVPLKIPKVGNLKWKENSKNILVERNWSPFVFEKELYVLYSLDPQIVLKIDPFSGESIKMYETETSLRVLRPILEDIAKRLQMPLPSHSNVLVHPMTRKLVTVTPHGGTSLVKVPGREYMLGVLHVHYPGPEENRIYVNYPYKISSEPPFEILSIGKALPLNSTRPQEYTDLSEKGPHYYGENYKVSDEIAFACDLTLWEKDGDSRVAVSYGVGDAVPRVFFTSIEEMEDIYFDDDIF